MEFVVLFYLRDLRDGVIVRYADWFVPKVNKVCYNEV